ncbi:DUF1573 domain-containing protein [Muriicola marianensis]|uniref:DUF1573 domain-containing protein n=1 Tax=Muriicola marianensis TaxID=1324801 RepID=A0ABQ1R5A5_9FLAO|nr:DUF1573 domain-containing protein [Muriicola marianensis]GGD56848.1 hypothetical protein GCM10011361_24230 [Muriicola marianensis]
MKRVFVALGVISMFGFVSCKEKASSKIETANIEVAAERDAAAKNLPVMTFDKSEHDFGNIEQGTPQETVFTFTNTGNAPLIITNATSSCGCTIPEYPKNKPIAPGETGQLLVKFNGSGQNQVTKTITVSANTAKGSELLRIKAFVNPKNAANTLGPVK